jgi:hypothetical protein
MIMVNAIALGQTTFEKPSGPLLGLIVMSH